MQDSPVPPQPSESTGHPMPQATPSEQSQRQSYAAEHAAAQCRLAQEAIANAERSIDAYAKVASPDQRAVLKEAKYGLQVAQGYRDDAARAVGRANAAELANSSRPQDKSAGSLREFPRHPSNESFYANEGRAKQAFERASVNAEASASPKIDSQQVANSSPTPAPRPSWAAEVDRKTHQERMSQDGDRAHAARQDLANSLKQEFSNAPTAGTAVSLHASAGAEAGR